MFPGGGAQYAGMARDLYETEPVFARLDRPRPRRLQPKLDYDLRALWLPEPEREAEAAERLKRPSVQLPLIMIVEYALAQLWMTWGVKPAALVGHQHGREHRRLPRRRDVLRGLPRPRAPARRALRRRSRPAAC